MPSNMKVKEVDASQVDGKMAYFPVEKYINAAKTERPALVQLCSLVSSGIWDDYFPKKGTNVILAQMEKRQHDRMVQRLCCASLDALVDVHVEQIANASTTDLILAAMEYHTSDAILQCHGCQTLAQIGKSWVDSPREFLSCVIPAILHAMRQHRSNSLVQSIALNSLVSLIDDLQGPVVLVKSGGLEDVIYAMILHPSVAVVQRRGCAIVCNLGNAGICCAEMVELGAVELITEAMKRFPKDAHLQDSANRALWPLSSTDSGKAAIMAIAGPVFIIRAMEANPSVVTTQRSGCGILWQLARIRTNRDALVEWGAKEILEQAMSTHSRDAKVEFFANHALRKLSGHKLLVKCKAVLSPTRQRDSLERTSSARRLKFHMRSLFQRSM